MKPLKNWDNRTWLSSKRYISQFHKFIKRKAKLNKNTEILDIGCGRANIISFLQKKYKFKKKAIGIDILKQVSFGFEIKEPRHFAEEGMDDYSFEKFRGDKESFENCFELHQMSRQFKFIDKKTKVLFVRNKIPRTLLRSKIKPKASIITIGGGLYSGGTENLKKSRQKIS